MGWRIASCQPLVRPFVENGLENGLGKEKNAFSRLSFGEWIGERVPMAMGTTGEWFGESFFSRTVIALAVGRLAGEPWRPQGVENGLENEVRRTTNLENGLENGYPS